MPRPTRETVRPTTFPAARASWPLTPIDRFASQWLIQGTWIFDVHLDANALKHGLARLLDAYPILCGRVSAGTRIEWDEIGVPLIEDTDATLGAQDFGPTCVDVERFGYRYSPSLIRLGLAPLLTVRLTHLRDGCVLAICASHMCLDGNGFYSMARNLSLATTGKPFTRPIFDRPPAPSKLRRRSAVARSAREAGWHRMTTLDAVRYALARPRVHDRSLVAHFSPETLLRCKDAMVRGSTRERLSTNSALLGHVAHCVVNLLGLDARSSLAVSAAVDQRGRVSALPEHFAGNAVSAVATAPIPARASAADIATRLHERLEPLLDRPSTELESIAALTTEVAAHRLAYSTIPVSRMLGRRPTLLYTNSFSKFPIYDVDFGEASHPVRPVRAIPHNLGDAILLWPAPPSVGGIELYFSGTLARAVARLGEEDPWWTALHSFDR